MADGMETGAVDWARKDGERMARKPFGELDGLDWAGITGAEPDQIRTYAAVAAEHGNTQLLTALGTATLMRYRVPQQLGVRIPNDEFAAYERVSEEIFAMLGPSADGQTTA